jgi:hypothetical protein
VKTVSDISVAELETAVTIVSFILCFIWIQRNGRAPEWLSSRFLALAANRHLAILVAGATPVLFRLILLPVMGPPTPQVIEEFSNVLQADTFASGRLTNPIHPMAEHFETFQVLVRPSYCSIRPPGQGLFLAAGQVIFGHPWAGVCISVFFFCAALCWMLMAWTTPGWSLFAALLFGSWYCVFGFWMNSYWGGTIAALGGCLVFGSLPRIWKERSSLASIGFALGAALLVSTRAYEGMLLIVPSVAIAAWHLLKERRARFGEIASRVLLPIGMVSALFTIWWLYYNWRTTGEPFLTPYELGRRLYNMAAPFVFLSADRSLHYHHEAMRRFYEWELQGYDFTRTPFGYLGSAWYKLAMFWRIYIRPELSLPFLLVFIGLVRGRMPLLAWMLGIACSGLAIEVWGAPYYYAPQIPVLVLAIAVALRDSSELQFFGRRLGATVPYATACACGVTLAMLALFAVQQVRIVGEQHFRFLSTEDRLQSRYDVGRQLQALPGRHLVLVRYHPDHNIHLEWVWNAAEVDASKIVWARSIDPNKDQALMNYFHDRAAWLADADSNLVSIITPRASRREIGNGASIDPASICGPEKSNVRPLAPLGEMVGCLQTSPSIDRSPIGN